MSQITMMLCLGFTVQLVLVVDTVVRHARAR
jgi:hypothetical protein